MQTAALSFPHLALSLQYLFKGFQVPPPLLCSCLCFGGSFSSFYTCCSLAPLWFLCSLLCVLPDPRTQCDRTAVLIFNLLNKEVEVEGLWASKTSLPSLNKHGSRFCLLWAGLIAEPEVLGGRIGQQNEMLLPWRPQREEWLWVVYCFDWSVLGRQLRTSWENKDPVVVKIKKCKRLNLTQPHWVSGGLGWIYLRSCCAFISNIRRCKRRL